jgi:hypothetical protein
MKNYKSLIFIILVFVFLAFSACDSRKAQEKEADKRLQHIELLINQNSLNAAKIEIDSIHLLFPRLVEKRKIAAALQDTIERRENARNLQYCDSILPFKLHQQDSIQKNFRFEKDTVYQQYGNFVYKTQRTENNSSRTYLKAYVDENADFYLISNYCGSKLDQSSVKVTVNDLFAKTDSVGISDPNYHSFDDGGLHWETLTFKNDADKGLAGFIAQNSGSTIKVTLVGKKRSFIYFLEPSDKQAIAETYRLWIVKKDVSELRKIINKSTIKVERINKRKVKSAPLTNQNTIKTR